MNDEIKVPDITPSPPPEVPPDYTGVLNYINLTQALDAQWNQIKESLRQLLYVPIVGWILYGIFYTLYFILYGILWLLFSLIEAVWNTIVDVVNSVYIWWKNFQRAVQERYNGDWGKAIIDVAVKIILMYALEYALNIPFVKQLWDIFTAVIRRINEWLTRLRDWITTGFKNITDFINKLPSQIHPIVRMIFRDEIEFWTSQINSLISTVRSELLRNVDKLDNKLTSWGESIIRWVEGRLQEWERLQKEISDYVKAVKEGGIWYVLFTMHSPMSITLYKDKEKKQPIMTYSLGPSQIDATYTTYEKATDDYIVNVTKRVLAIVDDVFDEKSEEHKRSLRLANLTLETIDDILNRVDIFMSIRKTIDGLNEYFEEFSDEIRAMEEVVKK